MTPRDFIARWKDNRQNERSAAQSYFNDLCELVGVPRPTDHPGNQLCYGFEGAVKLASGKRGYADVYWRGNFAGEFKRPGEPLEEALSQLETYAADLWNPPVLFVTDRLRIQIHLRFTGKKPQWYEIALSDLEDDGKRALIQQALSAPLSLVRLVDDEIAHTSTLRFTPVSPFATYDARQDAVRIRAFTSKIRAAYGEFAIGNSQSPTSIPSSARGPILGLNSYSAWRLIPDDLRSMDPTLKALQDRIVLDLAIMAKFVNDFAFNNERYWFSKDEGTHNLMLEAWSELQSHVADLETRVKTLLGECTSLRIHQ